MFADVRGSTGLAETIPAQEFSQLVSRFYGNAAMVVDRWDGLVDKFVGDEVVALFIPGLRAGADHAGGAIEAARELVREPAACDFTAVGDTVNTTHASPPPLVPGSFW
jgi:adenylate cyclase